MLPLRTWPRRNGVRYRFQPVLPDSTQAKEAAIDNKRSRQRAAAAEVDTADQAAAAPSAPLRNGAQ